MATCHISISRISAGVYELRVRTPGSSGRGRRLTRKLPPDFSDLLVHDPSGRPARKWRRPPTGAEDLPFWAGNLDTLKEIGGRLYESLFMSVSEAPREEGEDFTTAFLTARGMASEAGGLGLEIDLSEAPELSRIPWEALYLAQQDLLLGIDSRTNVVRRLEWDSPPPPQVQPPIRMLVAVANPDSALEAGTEVGDIERRLINLLREDETSYEIAKLPCATRIGLQDRIEAWKPHIIHFIGHGGFDDEQGLIYLHSGTNPGARDAIDSATLRDLIGESPPWLVVLNSCLSGAAAKADPFGGAAQNLIRANVPFVVAMQTSISDDAAIRFSRRFYAALAAGEPVATAVTRGRNGIRTLEDPGLQAELITPVLYTNGKAKEIAIAAPVVPSPAPASRGSVWAQLERGLLIAAAVAAIVSVPLAIYSMWDDGTSDALGSAPAGQPSAMIAPGLIEDGEPVASESPALPAPDDPSRYARYQDMAAPNAMAEIAAEGELSAATAEGAEPRKHLDFSIVPAQPRARVRRPASSARATAPARVTPPRVIRPSQGASGTRPDYAQSLPPPTATGPDSASTGSARRAPLWAAALERRRLDIERRRLDIERSGRYAGRRSDVGSTVSGFPRRNFSSRSPTARGGARAGLIRWARPRRYDYGTIIDEDTVAITESAQRAMLLPSTAYLGSHVVATFAAGSAIAGPVSIDPPAAALASPPGDALAIELVGNTDPRETLAFDGGLGLARAENVASVLRDRGVAAERIVTASAAARWSRTAFPPYRIEWKRDVEARLVLRGADRLAFAFDSVEVAADEAPLLDQVARFARENPGFWIRIEGHADTAETQALALSGRRIDSVRAQLRDRGVESPRLQAMLYGDSHPEVVGAPGPEANRRVQLVLVPPFVPESTLPASPAPVSPLQP